MAGLTDFGTMLARLLAHRGMAVGALAAAAGAPESELAAVLGGAEPNASLLHRLAPALGLHTSDLFLIAGRRVPDDLAPMGRSSSGGLGPSSLVWCLVTLPEAGRRVHELVRSLPQQPRADQPAAPEYDKWSVPGFGATLLRLFGNRNMNGTDAVKVLYLLARFGPWSPSTLYLVSRRRKEVTADLVAACEVVLGIPAGDLAALAGVDVPEQPPVADPATPEAVQLIWETRSLTSEQMEYLGEQQHTIRHEYDDVLPPILACHCSRFRGPKTVTPPERP